MTSRRSDVAPALFVVFWSTGFIVARYGTRDAGPLTFLAVRMAIAAALLALVAVAMRAPRPTRTQVRWMLVAGFGLHTVYLGGVFVAIDLGMPSGVSALIAGLHPVVTAVVAVPLLGERLGRRQWLGVALGFAGVVIVVVDRLTARADGITAATIAVSMLSVAGIAGGTLVQRRHGGVAPLLWSTVVQYGGAAVVLGTLAFTVEGFEMRATAQNAFALAWAVGVLSVVAVLLMLWLLQRRAAASVSSLFFLTPALSTIEGAVLFGERLGAAAVIGLIVSLPGVALVTRAATR